MTYTKRKTVVVDIDNTISDSRHRLHYVLSKPKNRDAFHAEFHRDAPIRAVVKLVQALAHENAIVLCTGRPDSYREATQEQMDDFGVSYDELYMRPAGNTKPNAEYKKSVLDHLRMTGHSVFLAIDDQQDVVDMWRANGIHCLQTTAV